MLFCYILFDYIVVYKFNLKKLYCIKIIDETKQKHFAFILHILGLFVWLNIEYFFLIITVNCCHQRTLRKLEQNC